MWLVINGKRYTIKRLRRRKVRNCTEIELLLDRRVDMAAFGHITASSESCLIGYSVYHGGGNYYLLTELL